MMDLGTTFRRTLKTWNLYAGRRESVRGALTALREQLAQASDGQRVMFRFTPGTVLTGLEDTGDEDGTADAVVFVAFRDGVRALSIDPTIPEDELASLIGILASGTEGRRAQADDVVAQLWAANLPHVLVSAVDPYADVEMDDGLEGEVLSTDLMPHVRGASGEASEGEGAAFVGRRRDDPNDGSPRAAAPGTADDAPPLTMADVVHQEVQAWKVPPTSVAAPPVVGPPAMRFARTSEAVDWAAIAAAREGARVALAIERIAACHAAVVAPIDALMQATLDAWRHDDARALASLVRSFATLPPATLDRWRTTLSMSMAHTTAVQEGLAAQATRVPTAVADWFRLAGPAHVEIMARALFMAQAQEVVGAWLQAAPENALVALQHWMGSDVDHATWATRCAVALPAGEARTNALRRALGHRDTEIQFLALQALGRDPSPDTLAALGRCLQSGRRDRVQFALREIALRSDPGALALLIAYAESGAFADVPVVQRAAVIDILLATPTAEAVEWVRERTTGWAWRLSVRGRERHAEISSALQRLPPDIRKAYP